MKIGYISGLLLIITGLFLLLFTGFNNGGLVFVRKEHIYALILLVLSGLLTWTALTLISLPTNKFEPSKKQLTAIGFFVSVSVLTFAKYMFLISP